MVDNTWGTVQEIAATGIMMGTPRFSGALWVRALHELLFGWLVLSAVLHLARVVYDTLYTAVPLIGAVMAGHKRIPQGREVG